MICCRSYFNGPPEIMHMDKVFSSGTYVADTTTFSNITANSVAGWIATFSISRV